MKDESSYVLILLTFIIYLSSLTLNPNNPYDTSYRTKDTFIINGLVRPTCFCQV
jgi:hypothetical protein